MLDMWPWAFFAAGTSLLVCLAYLVGKAVGRDEEVRRASRARRNPSQR